MSTAGGCGTAGEVDTGGISELSRPQQENALRGLAGPVSSRILQLNLVYPIRVMNYQTLSYL
jgi:hypothetical protein